MEKGEQVVVIGGGPGGYTAAIRAAQLGADVTLIEKKSLGGTCLNVGCIPTKVILHSAEMFAEMKEARKIGLKAYGLEYDWDAIQKRKEAVRAQLVRGVEGLCRANRIRVVSGEAKFTGPRELTVKKADGASEKLTAPRIIIAAGSVPAIPPVPGIAGNEHCIDSTAALSLPAVPERLAVIGGGVIGVEIATAFSQFGAKVTILEALPEILPSMDGQLTAILRARMEKTGVEILTSARVESVEQTSAGARIKANCGGDIKYFEADKVLVAVGRKPDTGSLNLAAAGVAEDKGKISVNEYMETNAEGVYAIGDCTGRVMLAHAASAQGETAAENAVGRTGKKAFDPRTIPSCVYGSPEFAGVGLTEEKAREAGIGYTVGTFPLSANGKALIMGGQEGVVKIIAGKQHGEILGVHILGCRATDLIAEGALAIGLEATAEEIISTIHGHPTVSETVREAALAVEGRAIHIPNKKGN